MAEKPFLSAAFLCERVLRETDEVLTAVRIVDTFYVTIPKNLPPDTKPTIQTTVLLSFVKAWGQGEAKHRGTIIVHAPSGKELGDKPPFELDILFKEDEVAKCNLIIAVALGIEEFGGYWIDVFVDDDNLVTRIPFKVLEREEPKTAH